MRFPARPLRRERTLTVIALFALLTAAAVLGNLPLGIFFVGLGVGCIGLETWVRIP